jgi:hypothetical protein
MPFSEIWIQVSNQQVAAGLEFLSKFMHDRISNLVVCGVIFVCVLPVPEITSDRGKIML